MCLYFRRDDDELVAVGIYVGNLMATGTSAAAVEKLYEDLKTFQMNK